MPKTVPSWPPFWRAVLHVAIAAGMTNVVAGASAAMATRFPTWTWVIAGLILAMPVLPPVVVAFLANADVETTDAVTVSVYVGALFCFIASLLWLAVVERMLPGSVWGRVGVCAGGIAGSAVTVEVFRRSTRSRKPRHV